MNPIDIALRRPIAVVMLFLVPITLGIIAFPRLPVERFPRTNFPFVSVNVSYPGASPEDVETQITERIENAVVGVSGIDHVTSNSNQGSSNVSISFTEDTDQNVALTEITRRINSVRRQLPAGAGEPGINAAGGGEFPIMNISISSEKLSQEELYRVANDEIAPELQSVNGVANVDVSGGRQDQIQVRVDPVRMQTQGVTLTQVQNAIRNWNLSSPGGVTRTDTRIFNTRTLAQAQTIADLEQIVIVSPGGGANPIPQPVYLKDVATIVEGPRLQTSYQRMDGKDSVGLRITQVSGANSLAVSAKLRESLDRLMLGYGQSAELTAVITSEQARFTRAAVNDTTRSLYLAALLAGLVLVLFLHNLRNTFIVLIAIPVSLVPTFFVMYLMGLSLNTVSLMGLALVIGILVDDSIVVIENINRHLHLGRSPWDAARHGIGEIGLATVAITLTSIAVFAPLAFMTGNVGRLFRELGIVMSVAIFFSLLVSLILTPMLASRLLREGSDENSGSGPWAAFSRAWEWGFGRIRAGYRRLLAGALRVRWLPVAVGFGMLGMVGAFIPLRLVGTEYVPREDNNQFSVNISMPPGTAVGVTDAAARQVEARLERIPEVEALTTSVREGSASIDVDVVEKSQRTRSVFDILNDVRAIGNDIPAAQVRTSVPSALGGGGGGGGINIIARGPDPEQLQKVATEVLGVVRSVRGTTEGRTSALVPVPEFRAVVDNQKAADLGVTPQNVGATLNAAVTGSVISQFRPTGQTQTDIVVQLQGGERLTPSQLGALPIQTSRNTTVRLDQVAQIVPGTGPAQISRYDRQRQLQISAGLTDRPLGDVLHDLEIGLQQLRLPVGYSVQVSGQGSQMNTAMAALMGAFVLSVIFMFMLLSALYESMIYPWAVVLSLPVALVGAFLGLTVTGNTINIFSMMGVILLVGLVAKNAILLIDYTNTLRRRGMSRTEAILEAGPTRLRPIVMTTLSVVFALLPLAIKMGEGAESRSPLAVAVIGGVLTSTLLTLVLVPCAYTYLDDVQALLLRLGARFRGARRQEFAMAASAAGASESFLAVPTSEAKVPARAEGAAGIAPAGGGLPEKAVVARTLGNGQGRGNRRSRGEDGAEAVAPGGRDPLQARGSSGGNGSDGSSHPEGAEQREGQSSESEAART
ncbi:MAG: efflux RND transporter permease subunit [Chloroflexi bacterium]|nr:efflux RND transporter permease subunit [Chloroflexota bacterium]